MSVYIKSHICQSCMLLDHAQTKRQRPRAIYCLNEGHPSTVTDITIFEQEKLHNSNPSRLLERM